MALNFISSPEIGWLKCHIFGSNDIKCPPSTRSVPAECPSGIGKEGKKEGIEGIGDNVEFKRNVFTEPEPFQVEEYAKSIGFKVDGGYFLDYYRKTGWKIKGSPIKDWKACVRTWKKFDSEKRVNGQKISSKPPSSQEILKSMQSEKS